MQATIMNCHGKLLVYTERYKLKKIRGSVPIVYRRHKLVSSLKQYTVTSFSFDSSNSISVGIQENSTKYHLKFHPKVVYKHPQKTSCYNSVVQWHIANNLYKVFTDIPFQTIMDMLSS